MQTVQGTTLEALRAIGQFLDKYADRLGDVVKSGSRRQLDQSVAELSALAVSQASSSNTAKGGTQKAKALRTVLVDKHMVPIARIAAVDLPVTPELKAELTMTKGNPTAEKLVAKAHAMAVGAAPFADTFIAAGMPVDFLAQLTAAADAVAAYAAQRKGNTGVGKAATKGIKGAIATSTRVLSAIDGLIVKALDDGVPSDALILSEWAAVKKTRKTPTRPAVPPAPVPIPPAPTTPAAVTTPSTGGAS